MEFELSEELQAIAKPGVGGRGPYMQFKRSYKGKKTGWRTVNFPQCIWQDLTSKIRDIETYLQERKDGAKVVLQGNYGAKVSYFGPASKWYVSLYQTREGKFLKETCMNLDVHEWEKLKEQLPGIANCLQGLVSKSSKMVAQYMWRLVFPSAPHSHYGDWDFAKDVAMREGEEAKAREERDRTEVGLLSVETRYIPPPCPFEIASQVWRYLIQMEISRMSLELCSGCTYGQANQEGHITNGGCLSEWAEKTELYFETAKLSISRERTTAEVYRICSWLNLPMHFCSVATDAVMHLTPIQTLKDSVLKEPLDGALARLFARMIPATESKPDLKALLANLI